jgi:hypothetical protein
MAAAPFSIVQRAAMPAALALLADAGENPDELLARH